jgi:hypothetical protein
MATLAWIAIFTMEGFVMLGGQPLVIDCLVCTGMTVIPVVAFPANLRSRLRELYWPEAEMAAAATVAGFTADNIPSFFLGIEGLLDQVAVIERIVAGSTGRLARAMRAVGTALRLGIAVATEKPFLALDVMALHADIDADRQVGFVNFCIFTCGVHTAAATPKCHE